MLIGFRVANFRSLRDAHELSFVACRADGGLLTGPASRTGHLAVLPAIGIYGANASGKSNLLAAMHAMRTAVCESVTAWAPAGGVPREPFALDTTCRAEPTRFEVDLMLPVTHARHSYGFAVSDERVQAEWLHVHRDGRRHVCFDRAADEFSFPGGVLPARVADLVPQTRPNALFLTVGAAFNDPDLAAVHRFFDDGFALVTAHDDVARRSAVTRELLVRPGAGDRYRLWVESLLQVADLGIVGVELIDTAAGPQVRLLHRTAAGEPMGLDLGTQESLGTHAWFGFLGPLVEVLERGSVLLADELYSNLHPLLAAEVVRLFADPAANPRGAQLVFTTHDATLLRGALGREQVWITEKAPTGETNLFPMVDVAAVEPDLERSYLRGRYGGVPRVDSGEVAREAGRHGRHGPSYATGA